METFFATILLGTRMIEQTDTKVSKEEKKEKLFALATSCSILVILA